MLLNRGKYQFAVAAMSGLFLASGMVSPSAASEPPGDVTSKSNISRPIGPGEKGRVPVGCGGTKRHIVSVSADVSGSSVSYPPPSFHPKSAFLPTKLKVGQVFNEVVLEFENTGDKNTKPQFRTSFMVALTIKCSTVPPEKPFGGEIEIQDSIMLPGSTIFGDGHATGTMRCPDSHPNHKSSSVIEREGVTYVKTVDYHIKDFVTYKFTNTNPREPLDAGPNMIMKITCGN